MDAERIFRELNVAEVLAPRAVLRQQEAMRRVIDETGKINPKAATPFRTPRILDYDVGTTRPMRAGRAGTLALASIRCGTAPSTGDAVITITIESVLSGSDTYPVTVPNGQTYVDETFAVPVNASDWIGLAVTTANGASAVSASLTVNVGV